MNRRQAGKLAVIIIAILFGFTAFVTSYFSDTPVEPEYISALLTACSITFAFWITLFAVRRPKQKEMSDFLLCTEFLLGVLSVSAFFVFLSALHLIPSSYALGLLFVTFLYHIALLVVYFVKGSFPSSDTTL